MTEQGSEMFPATAFASITIGEMVLLNSSEAAFTASRNLGSSEFSTSLLATSRIRLARRAMLSGSYYVAQAGLKFLDSCNPPTSPPQSAGIIGVLELRCKCSRLRTLPFPSGSQVSQLGCQLVHSVTLGEKILPIRPHHDISQTMPFGHKPPDGSLTWTKRKTMKLT
ncbi:hypothetical protein AAY473_014699 [Plecturocebus cupreus]